MQDTSCLKCYSGFKVSHELAPTPCVALLIYTVQRNFCHSSTELNFLHKICLEKDSILDIRWSLINEKFGSLNVSKTKLFLIPRKSKAGENE